MATIKLITDAKLKKALARHSYDELIDLVSELSSTFKPVKEFLTVRLGETATEAELCEKYKAIIENEFFPKRGFGQRRLKVAKAAIADFRKVCKNQELYIDILLFYVEQCVEFTAEYGDIDEPFYNSAESVYAKAVKEMNDADDWLYPKFAERFSDIADNACEGWGFQDNMRYIYGSLQTPQDDLDGED